MKNLISLCIALFLTINIFGQGRVNKALPKINLVPSGKLDKATGWLLKSDGSWASRQNKILCDVSNEYKALLDYEQNSLGIDNFISYELRDVIINDSNYVILIKKYKGGYFKYESIKEGWTAFNNVIYYVFNKTELQKFKSLPVDSMSIVKIQYLYSNDIRLNPITYLQDIQKDINEQTINTKGKLYIQVNYLKSKNLMQFDIYSIDEFDFLKGVSVDNNQYGDVYFNEKNNKEIFKHYYYETDLLKWNAFLN